MNEGGLYRSVLQSPLRLWKLPFDGNRTFEMFMFIIFRNYFRKYAYAV